MKRRKLGNTGFEVAPLAFGGNVFGWTAMGEPVEYREDTIHAIQVVAVGPNGFNLAIINNFPPPDQKRPYKVLSAYGGGTQMVADLDTAMDF